MGEKKKKTTGWGFVGKLTRKVLPLRRPRRRRNRMG